MVNEGIKPCPFCGSEPDLKEYCGCYYVECSKCHAKGSVVQRRTFGEVRKTNTLLSEAIEKWNRRIE